MEPQKYNSVVEWLYKNDIRNEKGDPITFKHHMYLFDIFLDQSPKLVVIKAAQVGMSTCEVLKNLYDAKSNQMDIIYTLPTDSDVKVFVGGNVNRIINNNPILLEYTHDKDSIEQKQVGQSMIYFRGTFTARKAQMIPADRVVHDEIDSSDQLVIRDFQSRLQHSKMKQTHVFSHPSVPNSTVDAYWLKSDQKEWFIKCPHCEHLQHLSWDTEDSRRMSIDLERQVFICKKCKSELSDEDRAVGFWRARVTSYVPEWSGYHVSSLMNPDMTAKELIEKYKDTKQTIDFFYNKVLGLPFAGGGNTVSEQEIISLHTTEKNKYAGRFVIGVDTGIAIRFVIGNIQGLVGFGEVKAYVPDHQLGIPLEETLEYYLVKFPNSVMVIDAGGDIIGSRQLRQKYPGRVFLCHYQSDRKTMQLVRWGEGDESGNVIVDRNRMISLVASEVAKKGFHLYNETSSSWHDYALHWTHIYRVWKDNALGVPVHTWLRADRDDYVHATVYWRVGLMRFGEQGFIINPEAETKPNSYMLNADGKSVGFNPDEMFRQPKYKAPEEDYDWRNI